MNENSGKEAYTTCPRNFAVTLMYCLTIELLDTPLTGGGGAYEVGILIVSCLVKLCVWSQVLISMSYEGMITYGQRPEWRSLAPTVCFTRESPTILPQGGSQDFKWRKWSKDFLGLKFWGFFGRKTLASLFGGWLLTSFPGSLSLGTGRREPWERGWVAWFTQDFLRFQNNLKLSFCIMLLMK